MRQGFVGGLAAVALVAVALFAAPRAWTQNRPDEDRYRADRHVMMLDGRGSVIGVRIAEGDKEGVRIEDVDEGSPAQKAGMKAGDVVVDFDGERVRSARQFARLVQETPDGRAVKTTIVRGGARQTIEITPEAGGRGWGGDMLLHMPDIEREVERGLRALPRDFAFDLDWELPNPEIAFWQRGRLGVQLEPLTDQLAEYFGAKEGVLVSSVNTDSAGAKAGLKAGDVITSVNGRGVESLADISEALRDTDDGEVIEFRVLRDRKELTLNVELQVKSQKAEVKRRV